MIDSASVLVVGTFDTKELELRFLSERLRDQGLEVKTVDVSTSGAPSRADVTPQDIASAHPKGSEGVMTGDRGQSVAAMAEALRLWIADAGAIAGMISAGGSGGTALVSPAMQTLSIGTPKVLVSTMASGDVAPYVGASDIMMMYSVTDVQGLNRVSRKVLTNAANALAGAVQFQSDDQTEMSSEKPPIGLTMFGVTTPAVQRIASQLDNEFENLVFHATGTGGKSMEKLIDSGLICGAIDLTTTEVCDYLFGGVLACDEDRFGAFIRTGLPYVGAVGALDVINFGAPDTVPDRYRDRPIFEHNPHVTLVRTDVAQNREQGKWIAERLNQMEGPVRFFLPEGGLSALDAPDQPFWDPVADAALFKSIRDTFRPGPNRQLISLPHHVNSNEFADALAESFLDIFPKKSA